jgi:ribosomal protein L37E
MPRYLMDLCSKYQEAKCPVDAVKNARKAQELNGETPLFPSGDDQEKLDEICEKCEERMFEIETPECPVCNGGIGPAILSWSDQHLIRQRVSN